MPDYNYRRNLQRADWIKIIGVGAGAGFGTALVAGYLARVLMQRTPLREPSLALPAADDRILPGR